MSSYYHKSGHTILLPHFALPPLQTTHSSNCPQGLGGEFPGPWSSDYETAYQKLAELGSPPEVCMCVCQ